MLEKLFESQQTKHVSLRIREAWAFDWQNHGESAALNRSALQAQPRFICAQNNVND